MWTATTNFPVFHEVYPRAGLQGGGIDIRDDPFTMSISMSFMENEMKERQTLANKIVDFLNGAAHENN